MTRPLVESDAAEMASLLDANRAFLAPWQPLRPDTYFTEDGQRKALARTLEQQAAGSSVPLVIVDSGGAIVGTMTLQSIMLRRIQAETLTHNDRSKRVLEQHGFVEYGRAPTYMFIAGQWQDNVLYQLITPTPEAVVAGSS